MEYLSRDLDNLYVRNPNLNFHTIRGFPIWHLSFADDFILFSNGSINNIKELINFLISFDNQSGLSINKDKNTFIMGKSINQNRINAIQRVCGFQSKNLPITYLGTPIYKGKKKEISFLRYLYKVSEKID
ncbi:hypothetical protein KFK09_021740 [Dendrobium nobile]|uniref:Reverse transcriptase domain-containing protein n=1 Tax=Dendrobium nobile TaxID=94219 RepID=A0A8T3AGU2_DENNO|nr:hypothetical protein KFK09_021740 [Dendrobium nobile]